MSFKTRVLDTLRSIFVAHPSTKMPHAMMNAADTNYRKTSPGFVLLLFTRIAHHRIVFYTHFTPSCRLLQRRSFLRSGLNPMLPLTSFAGLSQMPPSPTTPSLKPQFRITSVSVTITI
jgi:hypothetical protein